MAVTSTTLIELVQEAQDSLEAIEDELIKLQARAAELVTTRDVLKEEERALLLILKRRYPGALPEAGLEQGPKEEESGAEPKREVGAVFQLDPNDWSYKTRTEAVVDAVEFLTEQNGTASPPSIEDLLKHRNRSDKRDAIGAALAYLNRTKKIWRRGRGDWVFGQPA